MNRILVSAFSPFDIDPENSSALALEAFGQRSGVSKVILPVSFRNSWPTLKAAIEDCKPQAVLALGQADSRARISLEQVALNRIHARIRDEDGAQPFDVEVNKEGELALLSRLPNARFLKRLTGAGFDAELSYSAGTYVCNALMYHLVDWSRETGVPSGFVHFPLLKGQRLGAGNRERPEPTMTKNEAGLAVGLMIDELQIG